jgi:hypothetical protein
MVHAHLADEDLGIVGHREHREGKANEVVEVSLGGVDAARGGNARAQKVLRRGLAHRAGNPHHQPVGVTSTPLVGKAKQELLGVIVLGSHHGAAALSRKGKKRGLRLARHHDARCSRLNGGSRIVVAVNLLAEKRHKDGASADLARVYLDRASDVRGRRSLEQFRPRCEHEVCYVHRKHRLPHLFGF